MSATTATTALVRYGTVQYERGIEIVEVEGFLDERDGWLLVYGKPDRPADAQRHTSIPIQRVVEVDSMLTGEP